MKNNKKSQSSARHILTLIILLLLFALAMSFVIWQSKDVLLAWINRGIDLGFG